MEKEPEEYTIEELIEINVKALENFKNRKPQLLKGHPTFDATFQNITAILFCEIVKKIVANNDYEGIGIIEATKKIYFEKYMSDISKQL
ncbi:MAG: hypothetical protein ABR927_15690 [Bacteroidales bacterium]|jgi:hypothetical protein